MDRANSRDRQLRERAAAVIPGGMYGHQARGPAARRLSAVLPRGDGAHIWDVDGNRYLDFMCAYGPNLFGYANPRDRRGLCAPAGAGRHPDRPHRPDGRAGRGPDRHGHPRRLGDVLQERHGRHHHGADHRPRAHRRASADAGANGRLSRRRCPGARRGPRGTIDTDRAHQIFCDYNDVASLEAAVAEAGDDLAAIFAAPFKHDAFIDQAEPDPAYARRARELCDQTGALLVVDDVRAGFRLARDCSLEPHRRRSRTCRPGASASPTATRSRPCWATTRPARPPPRSMSPARSGTQAATMAAALETLRLVRETDYLERITALGERLRDGLAERAAAAGFGFRQTGPGDHAAVPVRRRPGPAQGLLLSSSEMLARGRLRASLAQHVPLRGDDRRRHRGRAGRRRRRVRRPEDAGAGPAAGRETRLPVALEPTG